MFRRRQRTPAGGDVPAEAAPHADVDPALVDPAPADPAPADTSDPADSPAAPASERELNPFGGGSWSAGAMASAPATPEAFEAGVERSRSGFMSRLHGLLAAGPSDTDWEEVEETLIAGDVGAALAMRVVERARARRDTEAAEAAVRSELRALLLPRDAAWAIEPSGPGQPAIILVIGVNGTGKTTTIGKLAARLRASGHSVLFAAADTFRAAAIEQLEAWATRSGSTVVAHAPGADPGAVVYDALDAAIARGVDVVIADTAGRLHTKSNLMDELAKVRRVIDKRLPGATPETLFVLDATTGQNGLSQARAFHETVGLTGIVLTKLDSTAKGGIVFAIEDAVRVPVRYVGVGEQIGDLIPFDPDAFVAALFE